MKIESELTLKVYNSSNFPLTYATPGSSGMDLRADIPLARLIKPMQIWKISTGIHLEIPEGFEGQVRGRSGLLLHHGIAIQMGTIDSDYRGEIAVILFNASRNDYTIHPGDRIAQLVIAPVVRINVEFVPNHIDLTTTERGKGGFGSTGR